MVEEREVEVEREGEEGAPGLSCPPSPPSPLPPGKRVLSARSLFPPPKKTRDHPDLSHCHRCGRHVPSAGARDRLRSLRSHWRVVLLCAGCLAGVQSADLCSYCFADVPEADGSFLDCLACCRRVHIGCVPREQPFLLPWQLDPAAFNCVDCCPIPKSRGRNPRTGNRVSLEDVVRDASSAAEKKRAAARKAKENALHKVEVAMRAAEAACKALSTVLVAKSEAPLPATEKPVANDEELALQLHLAMNGSQRISKNLGPLGLGGSADLKKARGGGGEPVGRDGESGKHRICENVEVCTEDRSFFDNMEKSRLVRSSPLDLDSDRTKEPREEIADKDGRMDVLLKELGSCSGKVNSSREEHTVVSALVYCRRPTGLNRVLPMDHARDAQEKPSDLQREKSSSGPDRYLRKYSKRHPSLKGKVHRNGSRLVSFWQMSCNEESRNFAEAPYNSNSVSMYSSSCASGFSGFQS